VGSTDQLFGLGLTLLSPKTGHHDVWLRKCREMDLSLVAESKINTLSLAAFFGQTEVVQYLLDDEKSAVDSQTSDITQAFGLAVDRGHVAVAKLLIDKRTDIVLDPGCIGDAFWTALFAKHEKVLQLLTDRGLDQAIHDPAGFEPLSAAICPKHESVVEQLLHYITRTNDAEIEAKRASIITPALRILIEAGRMRSLWSCFLLTAVS
jgi:hypothetical protein